MAMTAMLGQCGSRHPAFAREDASQAINGRIQCQCQEKGGTKDNKGCLSAIKDNCGNRKAYDY